MPKGPFHTKNSTALESVQFCHRRSFSVSVPFSCLLFLEKQALLSPLRSVLLRPYRICSPYRNSLSVLFLVRKGPLGAFVASRGLSDPTEIPPPYRETGAAIPLSHSVSCGIADYRCYTPASVRKSGLSQSKDRPNKGVSQKKLASEAYRAIGGVARNSIAKRAIVGQ